MGSHWDVFLESETKKKRQEKLYLSTKESSLASSSERPTKTSNVPTCKGQRDRGFDQKPDVTKQSKRSQAVFGQRCAGARRSAAKPEAQRASAGAKSVLAPSAVDKLEGTQGFRG